MLILAMDKKTVRHVSKDGHLHIAVSNISKANVCPYRGSEIPNGEDLGLDPDKVYYLLRHPDELAKAAPTFNNLPVLSRHVPVTSAAHPHELVVGSTGTDAVFNAPYLKNSLAIWDDPAIAGIESDQQRELSAAYHYVAEMTAGEFGGLRYDGIMRNIVGNHVALVPEGRAGSDVIVGDSKFTETPIMAKALKSRKALMVAGAVVAYVRPKLAADAKLDLTSLFADITAKNFKAKKARLATAIQGAAAGKLAQDASLDDVVELLDSLEDVTDGEIDEDVIAEAAAEPSEGEAEEDKVTVDADGDKIAELLAWLQGKLSDEDMAEVTAMVGEAADEPETENVAKDGGGKPMKTGMDEQTINRRIKAATEAVTKRMRDAAQAREDVQPYVGKVSIALDSAEDIYGFALEQAGVSLKDVPPAAYGAMVKMLPKPGQTRKTVVAQDAATDSDFAKRFPTAVAPKRI